MLVVKNIVFCVLILLFTVFLSINSQTIDIRFYPVHSNSNNFTLTLPVYVIILVCIALGLFIGTFFEFLRSLRHKRVHRNRALDAKKLGHKLKHLANKENSDTDEILRLLK